jgi:hypothetical protein
VGELYVREPPPELVAWLPEDVVQRMHPSIELILSFSFFYKLKAFHVVALYQNVDVHVQIVYDYGYIAVYAFGWTYIVDVTMFNEDYKPTKAAY